MTKLLPAVLVAMAVLSACGVEAADQVAGGDLPASVTTTSVDPDGPSTGGPVGSAPDGNGQPESDPRPSTTESEGASLPPSTRPAPTRPEPTRPGPTNADFVELEAKLITTVPDGYVAARDDVGDTGPSDFDKAVADEGDNPDAAEQLTAEGFELGYQRMWQTEDANLVVFLYRFATEGGAEANKQRTGAMMAAGIDGAVPASRPVGDGTTYDFTVGGLELEASLMRVGRYVVVVQSIGADAGNGLSDLIVKLQADRLV